MSDLIKASPDEHCRLCGHACLARRAGGEIGRCGAGRLIGLSTALAHYGEEPPISGYGDEAAGSGTIFFTRCVLRCVFCQNWQISQPPKNSEMLAAGAATAAVGRDVTVEEIADVMLELEARGVHNINLVSPTPYVGQLVPALGLARKRGLSLPVVYNTGGYDSLTALKLLEGLVDVYLPDAKMAPPAGLDIAEPDPQAARLLGAGDYPRVNRLALREMHRQVGPLRLDGRGLAQSGFLLRHLVLPDNLARTNELLPWLADTFGPSVHLSLMAQFHPAHLVLSHPEEFRAFPGLSRPLSLREYEAAVDLALDNGLTNTFIQDLDSAANYLPDFTRPKVFHS